MIEELFTRSNNCSNLFSVILVFSEPYTFYSVSLGFDAEMEFSLE